VLVQASKGAALAKFQRFLDKGELAQKRAVFLDARGEAVPCREDRSRSMPRFKT
jgi:hypothetical protein